MRAKSPGTIAGLAELRFLLRRFSPKSHVNDGHEVQAGDILLTLEGPARELLLIERTALNLIQRMSGIATLTRQCQKKAGACRIMGTRKTLWGALDKKAITVGGGLTHRLNLDDGILIKDNHLTATGSVKEALIKATRNNKKYIIEVEVKDLGQARQAAETIASLHSHRPYAIMLDNMTPREMNTVISEVRKLDKNNQILFEASGGITGRNIAAYAKSGVDVISLGALTHSAEALDISMKFQV